MAALRTAVVLDASGGALSNTSSAVSSSAGAPRHAVSADASVYGSKGYPLSRISASAPSAASARPHLAQTLMNALHTAALGTLEPGWWDWKSTSALTMDSARSTASSPDHDPDATPRANVVSKLDTAWLFAPTPASDARLYTSIAHRTFSALRATSFAAADNAEPKVRSVGSNSSASSSSSTAFAADRFPALAAAVMSELYVRTFGATPCFNRMVSTVSRAPE